MCGTHTMTPSVTSECDYPLDCTYWRGLNSSFFRPNVEGAGVEGPDNDSDDDSVSDAGQMHDDEYASATYEVHQGDVKAGIHAIRAKSISTERRIDSIVKRTSTTDKNMLEMKRNQVTMMKDMAAMMSMMKEMASKGYKGDGRIRRYQEKRTSKKAENRAEEENTGWSDE
jgi:hypothetical protein